MSDVPWRATEKIVQLLEQALDPGADVQHDVKLPDLVTGHGVQFDVVIRAGAPHRQTVSVVEVQKRAGPVEAADLRNWIGKMRSVGAHRLICVSAAGYRQSVMDAAIGRHGPAVLLLTLQALEEGRWPFDVAGGRLRIFTPVVSLDETRSVDIRGSFTSPGSAPITETDAIFSVGGGDPLTLAEVLELYLARAKRVVDWQPGTYADTILVRPPRNEIRVRHAGEVVPLDAIDIPVRIEVRSESIRVEVSEYAKTTDSTGAIAWVATAKGMYLDREVQLTVTFTLDQHGHPRFHGVENSGLGPGDFMVGGVTLRSFD